MFLCVDDFQKSIHDSVKIVYHDSFLQKKVSANTILKSIFNENRHIYCLNLCFETFQRQSSQDFRE